MNWLSQNLNWILLSGAGLIALLAWQRVMNRQRRQGGENLPPAHRDDHTVRDPVTGKPVDMSHALTADFEGRSYFFESENSRAVFQQDPARYVHRHHRHHGCC